MGLMYHYGRGVEKDYIQALEWYEKAAEQGHKNPKSDGADALLWSWFGKGPYSGAKWFKKSAEQGYVEAQYNMGLMYHYGRGVEKDYIQALEWYEKAAEQGHKKDLHQLTLIRASGGGIEED